MPLPRFFSEGLRRSAHPVTAVLRYCCITPLIRLVFADARSLGRRGQSGSTRKPGDACLWYDQTYGCVGAIVVARAWSVGEERSKHVAGVCLRRDTPL